MENKIGRTICSRWAICESEILPKFPVLGEILTGRNDANGRRRWYQAES